MFIARSARRIRFARIVFLLVGVLPCAALAAWAAHLRSAGHRESLRARWQQAIGLPLRVEAVEHLRPGVVRGRGCVLTAQHGGVPLAVPLVEIEDAPGELRLRVERIDLDADAAGLAAGLVAEWLAREARFPRDCVVDVEELHWRVPGWPTIDRTSTAGRLRLECVARDGSRAIRCVLSPAAGGPPAELRIVRAAGAGDRPDAGRHDVTAGCTAPLPLAIVARLLEVAALPALPTGAAVVSGGTLAASEGESGWRGHLAARLERVDLATYSRRGGWRGAGLADVDVRRLEWGQGQVSFVEAEVLVGPGDVGRGVVDCLIRDFGCRPREGLFGIPVDTAPRFDAAGMLLRLDRRGVEILAPTRMHGALAIAAGRPLLDPPAAIVPLSRLADWLAGPGTGADPNVGSDGMWSRLRDRLPRDPPAGRQGL